jgi:uncharacterized protein (DUF58 family)
LSGQEPLIDRQLLEKLERLTLRWKNSFAGLVGGHNLSRYSGPGIEFHDHRHFYQGDDLRAVNWRAYLRLEKLFLKLFQIEPRVPVRLLLDHSLSMSSAGAAKFRYAKSLAAALCYVGLVKLDAISVIPFATRLGERLVSSGGRHRFSPVVAFLENLETAGITDFFQVSRSFASDYLQRGLLIVISDFLDDGDCFRALQYLADFGHELLLLQVYAEEDREPPYDGELDIEDAETGSRLQLSFDGTARREYTDAFDAYSDSLERVAERNGGRFVRVSTAMPLEQAIFGPIVKSRTLD